MAIPTAPNPAVWPTTRRHRRHQARGQAPQRSVARSTRALSPSQRQPSSTCHQPTTSAVRTSAAELLLGMAMSRQRQPEPQTRSSRPRLRTPAFAPSGVTRLRGSMQPSFRTRRQENSEHMLGLSSLSDSSAEDHIRRHRILFPISDYTPLHSNHRS
jgi:hypothetical protein